MTLNDKFMEKFAFLTQCYQFKMALSVWMTQLQFMDLCMATLAPKMLKIKIQTLMGNVTVAMSIDYSSH